MEAFKKGDVVRLKSGGPNMTIQDTAAMGLGLICQWFDGNKVIRDHFNPESLKLVDEKDPESSGPSVSIATFDKPPKGLPRRKNI
jgi:uncharacterized protein YodC (DUF2158 family)